MVQQLIEDMQAAPEVVVIGSRASTVLVSYTTVSYTHLDVYKRQGLQFVFTGEMKPRQENVIITCLPI